MNIPKPFSSAFLLLTATFAGLWSSSAETTEEWFTLDIGDVWTFEDTTGKMSIKVLEEQTIGDETAFRIGWFVDNSEEPYQAEYWRKEGKDYVVVAREIAGRKLIFDTPYVFIRETMKPGDSWTEALAVGGRQMKLTFTVGEKESIETDLGTFEALKVTISGPPQTVERWYAPSIGMVKEITRLTLGGRTSPGNEKKLVRQVEGKK